MIPAGGDKAFYENYAKEEKYFSSQEYKDKKKRELSGKRKLPHPKVMSYPVAVSPDEINGSRLLIKCFEYIPPRTAVKHGFQTRRANENFKDAKGVKQKKGQYIKNKDKTLRSFKYATGMDNRGASDQFQSASHLYYIELPIPQDVNDSNTVTWGDNSLNMFQLAGLTAAQDFFEGKSIDEISTLMMDPFLDEMYGKDNNFRQQLSATIAGKAFGADGSNIRPNTILGRATGEILNSNLELLFDSVNLRSFPFNITFSPRNQKEALRVKHIIRALKSSMAAKKGRDSITGGPKSGQGGIFLKAPDVFHLKYLHNGKEHPFLNSFKHCALTGMTVNYTNAGTFASYSDGTPVSVQMNLTFKELNPIYQEDYEKFDDDSSGVGF